MATATKNPPAPPKSEVPESPEASEPLTPAETSGEASGNASGEGTETPEQAAERIKGELAASFEFGEDELETVEAARGTRTAKPNPYEADLRFALKVAQEGDLKRLFGVPVSHAPGAKKSSTIEQTLRKAELLISGVKDGTTAVPNTQPAIIDGKPVALRLNVFKVTRGEQEVWAYRWKVTE